MIQRTFSSESCADAMVRAGEAAEAENVIDNSVIQDQHAHIERLERLLNEAASERDLLKAALEYYSDEQARLRGDLQAATEWADSLLARFEDHYWDTFERDKSLVLDHVKAVLGLNG